MSAFDEDYWNYWDYIDPSNSGFDEPYPNGQEEYMGMTRLELAREGKWRSHSGVSSVKDLSAQHVANIINKLRRDQRIEGYEEIAVLFTQELRDRAQGKRSAYETTKSKPSKGLRKLVLSKKKRSL